MKPGSKIPGSKDPKGSQDPAISWFFLKMTEDTGFISGPYESGNEDPTQQGGVRE